MAADNLDEDLDLGIEKSGSSKKMIIIIAVVVTLLLVGGLGAGWMMFGGDQAAKDPDAEEQQDEVEKLPALYLPLEPTFVVNLPPGGKVKMLQIGIQVMTRNPLLVDYLKNNDPMIRHNLLNLFSTQEGDSLMPREGKERLQSEVQKTLNKLVVDQKDLGQVEAVYFTSFVMQ